MSRRQIAAELARLGMVPGKALPRSYQRVRFMLTEKKVFLDGKYMGVARTWGEVAQLLSDPRLCPGRELHREGSEGPDAFFIKSRKP